MNAREFYQWLNVVTAKPDDQNSFSGRPTFLTQLSFLITTLWLYSHPHTSTYINTFETKIRASEFTHQFSALIVNLDCLGFISTTDIEKVENRHL